MSDTEIYETRKSPTYVSSRVSRITSEMSTPVSAVSFVKLFTLFVLLTSLSLTCYGVFSSQLSKMKQDGKFEDKDDDSDEILESWLQSIQYEKGMSKANYEEDDKLKRAFSRMIDTSKEIHDADDKALEREYVAVAMLVIGFIFIYFLSFTMQLISGQDYSKKGDGDKFVDVTILAFGGVFVMIGAILLLYTSTHVCDKEKYNTLVSKIENVESIFRNITEWSNPNLILNQYQDQDENQTLYKLVWNPNRKRNKRNVRTDSDGNEPDSVTKDVQQKDFKLFELHPTISITRRNFHTKPIGDAESSHCASVWKTTAINIGAVLAICTCLILFPAILCVACMKEPNVTSEQQQQEPGIETGVEAESHGPLVPVSTAATLAYDSPSGQVGYNPETGSYGPPAPDLPSTVPQGTSP